MQPKIKIAISLLLIGIFSFTISKPKKSPKKIAGFQFVEGGTLVTLDRTETTVSSFYMLKHEITNLEYREFLSDSQVLKDANYKSYLVDSTGWRDKISYGEPMVIHYHKHPAYSEYPVLNISREGAEAYCKWLTNTLNDLYSEKLNVRIEARLPSKNEWIKAAKGGAKMSIYPWGGPYIRNAQGCILCNCNPMSSENIIYDYEKKEYRVESKSLGFRDGSTYYTAKVESYAANNYGLYDMSGNAAEMVQEEGIAMGGSWNSPGGNVTVESEMPFSKTSKEVGFRPILVLHDLD